MAWRVGVIILVPDEADARMVKRQLAFAVEEVFLDGYIKEEVDVTIEEVT